MRSTIECAMFAPHPRVKVFVHLFQKVAQSRARSLGALRRGRNSLIVRKTQERVNFFAKQRKRENPRRGFSFFSWCFFMWGKENFLKEVFPSPIPPSFQELSSGVIFKIYIVRSTVQSAMFVPHPRVKVFARLFQKAARVWGE